MTVAGPEAVDDREVVLVTGASRGFGLELVKGLQPAGCRPIATMRDVAGRNREPARALTALGIDVVELDVTRAPSIETAVTEVLSRAGRVDVLVSNAGSGIWGPVEVGTTAELRSQLETTIVGPRMLIAAIVPGMRERGSGLLVHVSSVAGRLAVPGFGLYSVAKWGLEAMAEVLRYELAPFGIDSVIVEPGAHDTDFHGSSMQTTTGDGLEPYEFLRRAEDGRRGRTTPGEPGAVVDAIVRLIRTRVGERPLRLPVGTGLTEELTSLNREQARITAKLLEGYRCPDLLLNGD